MRALILALALATAVSAQFAAVALDGEPAPQRLPAPFAEPRVAKIDPDEIYRNIVSGTLEQCKAAYLEIGFVDWSSDEALDVKLMAVNLDEDPALERVLMARNIQFQSVAIFDWGGAQWKFVGSFLCCGRNASSDRNPFVELRQTVWYGVNDLVVHTGGSMGTGVGESRVSVYRMRGGRLYQVFDNIEDAYNWTSEDQATFRYPDIGRIQVQRVKRSGQRKAITCTMHSWDSKQFVFVAGPAKPGPCPQ
jgi:hypothetical protein